MKYILALDAGTGSVRAILFDEKGNQVIESQREYRHRENKKYPGGIDFDYENNWTLIVSCIKDVVCKVRAKDIKAISSTSMREAFVLYDENKKEIFACSNVDARAYKEIIEIRKDSELEKKIYKITGQTFSLSAIPRLLWLKKYENEIYKKIKYMNMLSDWIAFKLGAQICIDPSNGSTSGIFSLKKRNFDFTILDLVSLNHNLMNAKVYESSNKIGYVSENASKETGLIVDTPIFMGGGDAQLGVIGVGSNKKHDVTILGGTFWQQEVNIDKCITHKNAMVRINCGNTSDIWQAEGIAFYPGLVARWFRDAFCPDIIEQGKKSSRNVYSILDDMTREIPAGSYGIIPIFSDKMNYMSWKHASPSFLNMTIDPKKTNRSSLFKSIMENTCLVSLENINTIKEFTKVNVDFVRFAGGSSNSSQWCQILADVLQVEVHTTKVKEATALGAAMCAAVGIGLYANFDEISKDWVKKADIYTPNINNKNVYEDLSYKFKEAYKKQLELADANITTHMWKAPGE